MSILAQIRDDLKQAMINKEIEKRDLLRVLVGDIDKARKDPKFVGKDFTDEDTIKVVKSMIKSATIMDNANEIKLLNVYMPVELDEAAIKDAVKTIINDNDFTSMANMGATMKIIRETYGAAIDNKVASKYVKEILGS